MFSENQHYIDNAISTLNPQECISFAVQGTTNFSSHYPALEEVQYMETPPGEVDAWHTDC